MSEPSAKHPFFAYSFTKGYLNKLNNVDLEKDFSVTLSRGDRPAPINVIYQQDKHEEVTGQCIDTRSATVRPVAGGRPSARLDNYVPGDPDGAGVTLLSAAGGCDLTQPVPAVITVRGNGASSTITTRDECSGSWRVHGHTPGVSTTRKSAGSGSRVEFHPAGSLNRAYRLAVRIAGRVVQRGVLRVYFHLIPDQRIYEGTDAFVNYCIDQTKTIYSYHNELYCTKPGSITKNVSITKH